MTRVSDVRPTSTPGNFSLSYPLWPLLSSEVSSSSPLSDSACSLPPPGSLWGNGDGEDCQKVVPSPELSGASCSSYTPSATWCPEFVLLGPPWLPVHLPSPALTLWGEAVIGFLGLPNSFDFSHTFPHRDPKGPDAKGWGAEEGSGGGIKTLKGGKKEWKREGLTTCPLPP